MGAEQSGRPGGRQRQRRRPRQRVREAEAAQEAAGGPGGRGPGPRGGCGGGGGGRMIKLFSLKQQKKEEESAGGTKGSSKKASAAQLRIQKGRGRDPVFEVRDRGVKMQPLRWSIGSQGSRVEVRNGGAVTREGQRLGPGLGRWDTKAWSGRCPESVRGRG